MEFLHPAMWHDDDIDFASWLHPAMWHVALESWHRRRHRVVVEDRSVAPVWPRWMAARHRSAGGRW